MEEQENGGKDEDEKKTEKVYMFFNNTAKQKTGEL